MRHSVGLRGRVAKIVRYFSSGVLLENAPGPSVKSVLERRNIVQKIKDAQEPILTWLNRRGTVMDKVGNKVSAAAIPTNVVDNFAGLSHAKIKEEYKKQVRDPTPIPIYFCRSGKGSLSDLQKRSRGTIQGHTDGHYVTSVPTRNSLFYTLVE